MSKILQHTKFLFRGVIATLALGQARPVGPLSSRSLARSPQIGMGSQMILRALQAFVPTMLSDEVLDRIDRALRQP